MLEDAKDRLNRVLKDFIYAEKVRTKVEFAALLGYDVSYVSQLLNGKRDFTPRICKRVFEKTGINPDWLMYGTGEMIQQQATDSKESTFTSTTKDQKPDIQLKKNPTAEDIEAYVQALMQYREKQMEERIIEKLIDKLKK